MIKKDKNIEALLFTDLHIQDTNLSNCEKFLSCVKKYVHDNNIKNVFFLGDLVDNRKGPSEIVITFIIKQIEKLIENEDINFYLIPGNHDKFIESSEESYLNILPYISKRIILIKNIECVKIQKYNYIFFPYFEREPFEKALEYLEDFDFKNNNPTILLGHYMYEQIPIEIKKKFKKIFLGHNHEREEFPNGMYLGSCFQQNFAEDNNKGCTILYEDLTTSHIPFVSEKEYVNQKIDINSFDEHNIREFIIKFKQENPNKILRIEFNGYNKDISNLKEFCKQNDVYFISKVENNTINEKEEILNIATFSKNQIEHQFMEFCKENNIPENTKEKILQIIKKSII